MDNIEKKSFLFECLSKPDVEKIDLIESAMRKTIMPKYLYRYRPLNGIDSEISLREFSALENHEMWGSKPSTYTDDTTEILHKGLIKIDDKYKPDIDIAFKYCLGEIDNLDKLSRKIPDDVINLLAQKRKLCAQRPLSFKDKIAFKKMVYSMLMQAYNVTDELKLFRDNYVISCFSDRDANDTMWEQYALNHKGFCMKYSIKKLYENNIFAMPVLYDDDAIDVGKQIEALFFIKYNKYSVESEWRVINISDSSKSGKLVKIVSPDDIICGKRIDDKCRERLRDFCIREGNIAFKDE